MALMALQSGATGLGALSTQLDVISNNLANANNNGFKSSRVNFEDLMYQQMQQPGVSNNAEDVRPTGIEVGLGTRVSGTQLDFTQGSPVQTGRTTDVMINGNGFFRVKTLPNQGDGLAYTRTGSFFVNPNNQLVLNSSSGYVLDPPVTIPANATAIDIGNDGRVYATLPGTTTPTQAGQIQIASFTNPQGLTQIGGNLYQQTAASGTPVLDNPGNQSLGTLQSGALEASNVDPVNELVSLIQTQRIFEMNSQSIQAADQMLQTVSNLRH
jgi:flagellar basal-body rod protein FlgG